MPHARITPEHILRAREIVARLSVEEKVAQLEAVPFTHFLDESGRFSEAKAEEIAKYGVGIVKRVYGNGAFLDNAQMAREFNRLQEFLVKRSTARLPAMIEEEAAGGLMAPGATAFPSPLAMASTFDPELMSRVADAIGRQARALVGLVNPSGRLPVTIPSSVGDVPVRHGLRRSSASDITVRRPRPLFPFGHGLSYSKVAYSDLRAGLEGGVLRVSLKLTNEGPLEAEEVPQLYVSPPSRLYERPSLELIGLGRVRLRVGESMGLSFEVGLEALSV
ncbi:MAG: glycoside hydrolase family 3 C-terminal domain-containing protein, partial [Acidilobus sp.]|nr:glycoside hydrolase family 3 C-terminal domain-containing protein [Acidilobus sp.]